MFKFSPRSQMGIAGGTGPQGPEGPTGPQGPTGASQTYTANFQQIQGTVVSGVTTTTTLVTCTEIETQGFPVRVVA